MTQPLQQEGDLSLQDVDDDLQDLQPLKALSSQELHAVIGVSKQMQIFMPHHDVGPIKRSEVSKGMEPWLLPLSGFRRTEMSVGGQPRTEDPTGHT